MLDLKTLSIVFKIVGVDPSLPEGFGPTDRYENVSPLEACSSEALEAKDRHDLTQREYRNVLDYCEHRVYSSSRGKRITSVVDGSAIHDRDRPTSYQIYRSVLAVGILDPNKCRYHSIDESVRHPSSEWTLWKKWPYRNKLTERMLWQWKHHSHDYERFGARGYHDHNANAYRYLPGCWDPKHLERKDVGTWVTVEKASLICKTRGCATWKAIRAVWGNFDWRGY